MSLMPDALRNRLPGLGTDLETPLRETMVQAHYFDPVGNWKWYVLEFDGEDTLFGIIVTGMVAVPGQFTLSELEEIVGRDSRGKEVSIQLDHDFSPCSVEELASREPAIAEVIAEASPREQNVARELIDLEP